MWSMAFDDRSRIGRQGFGGFDKVNNSVLVFLIWCSLAKMEVMDLIIFNGYYENTDILLVKTRGVKMRKS